MQSRQRSNFTNTANAPAHMASRSCAFCKAKLQRQVHEVTRRHSNGWPRLPTTFTSPWVPHAVVRAPAVTSQSSLLGASCSDGDVLRLQLSDGRHAYVEAVSGASRRTIGASPSLPSLNDDGGQHALRPHVQLLCQGVRYFAREASTTRGPELEFGSPTAVLEAVDGDVPLGDPNFRALLESPPKRHVAALRAWAPLATRFRQSSARPTAASAAVPAQQAPAAPAGTGNADSLDGAVVVGADRITSLEQLRGQAATEPGAWVDGSGPSEPPVSEDARAVATAGELACLLEGQRGVVLLQLHVGWDAPENVPPYGPYKPLVLRLLRDALERPDIVSYTSSAPVPGATSGNPAYGMTLVLCADKEPFRSWGAHLASFGCQAALEAQSPYYKLLIGRILGYRPDYIAHHIQEKHGMAPSREVLTAVEQQLLKLSSKKPKLPWNVSSRGSGARKKAK